jgi:hypothetical protein
MQGTVALTQGVSAAVKLARHPVVGSAPKALGAHVVSMQSKLTGKQALSLGS